MMIGSGTNCRRVVVCLLLVLLPPTAVRAQSTLSGTVRCDTPLPPWNNFECRDGVMVVTAVEVASVDGMRHWQTFTSRDGEFTFQLAPGHYRLTVHQPLFPKVEKDITVAGRRTVIDLAVGMIHPEWRVSSSSGKYQNSTGLSLGFTFWDALTGKPAHVEVLVIAEDESGRTWQIQVPVTEEGPARVATLVALANLPPGRYRISVFAPPFYRHMYKRFAEPVELKERMYTFFPLILPPVVSETLTVDSRASTVNDDALSLKVSGPQLPEMFLANGRTLQSLQSLAPGTVVTDSIGNLAQFTAAGARRFGNQLSIDGMNGDLAVDLTGTGIGDTSQSLPALATSGSTQTLIPLGAVEGFSIRTTNATPELAKSSGAATSIVTRSGTDHLSGSVFLDVRPNGLAASDWFSDAGQAPRRQLQFWNAGASGGGPIVPRRLHYFATWEQQHIERPVQSVSQVPSVAAREALPSSVRPLLAAFPIPNGPDLGNGLAEFRNLFPARSDLSVLNVRVDGLMRRHHLFGTVNVGGSDGDGLDQLQTPATGYARTESTLTRTATIGLMSAAPSVAHDLRVNVSLHEGAISSGPAAFGNAQPLPIDLLAPARLNPYVNVTLFPGPNGQLVAGTLGPNQQRQIELADTLSIARGRHQWRIGLDYRHVRSASDGPSNQVLYRFGGVSDLLQGRVRQVAMQTVAASRAITQNFSVFAQDAFRVSDRLSLDYGVRYIVQPAPGSGNSLRPLMVRFETLPQVETLGAGIPAWNTSWANVAPQISLSYRLRAATGSETILRGGWGTAFDDLARPGSVPFGRSYPYVSTSVINTQAFPVAGDELTAPLAEPFTPADRGQYYSFPRNLKTPRTYEWHVGLDHTFRSGQRASLAYVGTAGRDLLYWTTFYAGNPTPTINAYSNDGRSDYNALLAEYVLRSTHGLSGQVTYAWSHSIDNDSGENLNGYVPTYLISPNENRGSSDFDRRHVLRATVSYEISAHRLPQPLKPWLDGWHFDLVGIFRSGAPISVTTFRTIGGGSYPLRPDVVPGALLWVPDGLSATGMSLNPSAFQTPSEARQGTLGRNALQASPLRQVNLAVSRRFRFNARVNAQLRIEAFNAFNIPNFGPPSATFPNSQFGRPYLTYAQSLGTGTLVGGGLTPLEQDGNPRSVQIGIRFGM
jgi:hypothetical protein